MEATKTLFLWGLLKQGFKHKKAVGEISMECQNTKISYVIPCYCSAAMLEHTVLEIDKKMQAMPGYRYEIILVNDASPDQTFDTISKLCASHGNITGINLAKNFGQHSALMAGYRYVSGDIIVCLDDDGQTPADEADKLIRKLEEGYDAVYASYAAKQHSAFRRLGSWLNSKMAESMIGKPGTLYISSYFAVKRFVIEEIKKYENPYPYIAGLVLRTSRNICNVPVTHRKRESGQSGYSLGKLIALWVNGFTSFSVKPLRAASFGGILTALAGFLYAGWAVIKKFADPGTVIGWSSTIAVILIIGGMVLCVLGVIGEYVGRIYISLNNSPQYVIREVVGGNKASGIKAERNSDGANENLML